MKRSRYRNTKSQMSTQSKNGGFLGALAGLARGLIPVATRIASKVVAPLATGASSGLTSTGIGKLFGSGMITIPASRKTNVIKIQKGKVIRLRKANQFLSSKNKDELPLLSESIVTSLILSVIGAITGKGGLQIGSRRRGKGGL